MRKVIGRPCRLENTGARSISIPTQDAKNMEEIDAVLEEMRSNARSAKLQESCGKALASLAWGNAENKGKIGAQGGIELLLEAMRRHAGSADVQK